MIKKLKMSIAVLMTVLVSSCSLDLLDNPNAVTPGNTDVNFLLSNIELTYAGHFGQMSDPGMRLTRMLNQGAAIYQNAVSPVQFDGTWTVAYAGLLNDVKALIPIAEKSGLFVHVGISKILRASVLVNLVDAFGDVPYSEALDATNFTPKTDGGATVYAAALKDLDEAIADLAKTSKGGATVDLIYAGNVDSWTRLANSLKLKIQLNRKLVDNGGAKSAIDGLISGGKLISTSGQNFVFKYGNNLTNPDTRHPNYAGQYSPTGGGDYQSNHYMGVMYNSKGFPDPRMRYYFYRQTTKNTTDVNQLRCVTNDKPRHYSDEDVYCLPTKVGYWGRDHLSNEGIPPDGLLRTAWGLYPSGGLYDNDASRGVSLGAGAGGAGIQPIMMASFVDFMLAESALTLGTAGDPKELLKTAITKSMADVRNLALGSTEAGKIATFEAAQSIVWATEVTKYVDAVMALYDAATTTSEKMDVIGREYWIALHGNGIEAYNLYRRTGAPGKMQPALEASPGGFARSYYYPNAFTSRNATAKQKDNVTTPVFWDTNPATLTK